MSDWPHPKVLGERNLDVGQHGLALQHMQAGLGAELDQPGIPGEATPARPAGARQLVHQLAVGEAPTATFLVFDLAAPGLEPERRLSDLEHPVTAYLNGLAPSSRRPQLSALDWIARRATQPYTAETMPWHQLRRPHVLRIRGLLEESYQPAAANRMLSALRGVLKECWQAQLMKGSVRIPLPAAGATPPSWP